MICQSFLLLEQVPWLPAQSTTGAILKIDEHTSPISRLSNRSIFEQQAVIPLTEPRKD
jgi:hypothetical protein